MMYGEEVKGCTCNTPNYPVEEKNCLLPEEPNFRDILMDTRTELMAIDDLTTQIIGLLLNEHEQNSNKPMEVNSMATNVISNFYGAKDIRKKLERIARTLGV